MSRQVERPPASPEAYERWFRSLDRQVRVLERERQKFSAVVNHTDAGFIVVDAAMRVVWANEVFSRRFRGDRPAGAEVGLRCHQVLCGNRETCESCPAPRPFETGAVAHHEMSLQRDGRRRHLYVTAMPIKSLEGKIEQCIIMLQDVSDLAVLRASEESLRISEERFRSIFENVGAGMITCRIDGKFLHVNPKFCQMLGYTRAELLENHDIFSISHPDHVDEMRHQLAQVEAGSRRVIEMEKRYLHKSGPPVWGHTTAVWLFDADGRPTYAVVLIQDITARKGAVEELRRSKREYEALVNSIDGIVWETDAEEFSFAFVSGQAERILGYPVADWLDSPTFWQDHIHPADRDEAVSQWRRSTGQMQDHEFDYRMIAADGRVVWIRDSVSVVVENGRPVKLHGIMVDITDRKQAEEELRQREDQLRQAQKMEAIGRLAGGIAHDFNNLLTAISGYNQLLLQRLDVDSPRRREAQEIGKAAEQAAALTGQLLAFSRRQVLQPKVLDLNAVIEDMDKMLRRVIGADVELVSTLGDGLGSVRADPSQIQQVLMNLVVNARDAMPDGGVIMLESTNVDLDETYARERSGVRPGPYVMVCVTDTGCGMDQETRAKLFEPFFTTKRQGEGTGLGLSTVYGIIKQSRGNIWVYSEPGRGTAIKIYLPRVDDIAPDAARPQREARGKFRGSETILLAEDDEAVRSLTREILAEAGYRVLVAPNGVEAVELARPELSRIDLLLTDLIMPRMGGAQLARTLVSLRPEIQVLFMSGYTDSAAFHQGLLQPGSSFIQKPFTPAAMLALVRELLDPVARAAGEMARFPA